MSNLPPKFAENFDPEQPATHPYRPYVIVVALIIVCSVFGGGLFYHYLQTNNGPDMFEFTDQDNTGTTGTVSGKPILDESERAKLFQNSANGPGKPILSEAEIAKLFKQNK